MSARAHGKRRSQAAFRLIAWLPVAAVTIAVRPRLWGIALVEAISYSRRQWYLRPPFLPVPSMAYLRFRMETAYGTADALPASKDLVDYLDWCRRQRRQWV